MSETSRTFDLEHGAVHVGIKDSFGKESFHTFYLAGLDDIETEISKRTAEVETHAAMIRERMMRAGWKPPTLKE
jgi:hypothetical protein